MSIRNRNFRILIVSVAMSLCGLALANPSSWSPIVWFAQGIVEVTVNSAGDVKVVGDNTSNYIHMTANEQGELLIMGMGGIVGSADGWHNTIRVNGKNHPPNECVVLSGTSRNSAIDIDLGDTVDRAELLDISGIQCKRLTISDGPGDSDISVRRVEAAGSIGISGGVSGAERVSLRECACQSVRINLGSIRPHEIFTDHAIVSDSLISNGLTFRQSSGPGRLKLEDCIIGGAVNLSALAGDDELAVCRCDCDSLLANMSGGNDTVTLDSNSFSSWVTISTAADDDTVSVENTEFQGNTLVKCGSGDDTVTLDGSSFKNSVTINTAADHDTVSMEDAKFLGNAMVICGAGNDAVFLDDRTQFQKRLTVNADTGGDLIHVDGAAFQGDATLNGGSGNDWIFLKLASNPSFTDAGFPQVVHGNVRVNAGGNDDSVATLGDTLSLRSLSILLGSGNDDLNCDWNEISAKSIRFSGNAGQDHLDTHDTVFNPYLISNGFIVTPPDSIELDIDLDSPLFDSILPGL